MTAQDQMEILNSLRKLFKAKEPGKYPEYKAVQKYSKFVFATIVEPLTPDERNKRYADPLTAYLEEQEIGVVTGGGTLLGDRAHPDEKDIINAGIDIELANLDEALALTKSKLIELGAPFGSNIQYEIHEGKFLTEPIGELELLYVFIDNVNLSDEIYENIDTQSLYRAFDTALAGSTIGEARGSCIWKSETLIYFAGKSADEIFEKIDPLRTNFPILQNARILFQRKDKEKQPKELRIPFNPR